MKLFNDVTYKRLIETGEVATIRSIEVPEGEEIAVQTPVGEVKCIVKGVYDITDENLKKFVGKSGYDSVKEWLKGELGILKREARVIALLELVK